GQRREHARAALDQPAAGGGAYFALGDDCDGGGHMQACLYVWKWRFDLAPMSQMRAGRATANCAGRRCVVTRLALRFVQMPKGFFDDGCPSCPPFHLERVAGP